MAPTDADLKSREATIRVLLGFVCPELAQPARSLEMAREAMKFNPEDYDYLPSLGAALHANGRYEEAKTTFLKAFDFQTKPRPDTLFFLAMTESELGRQADARRTYDSAVARMNETWPKSPDLVMLKTEAGKIVGAR